MLVRLLSLLAVFMSLGQTTLDAYVAETNLGGMLYLVNRDYALARAYEPGDLVKVDVLSPGGKQQMRQEAALALEAMFAAAKEEGYQLAAISGYRSYSRQRAIWQRKVSATGSAERAQLVVAPPGTSEHQLGLAMDVASRRNGSLTARFGETDEGQWVAENAHRFGYIIRYQEEWTDITGYSYEPWHLRYIGPEHAQRIYDLDLPLETYVAQLRQAAIGDSIGDTNR